MSFEDSNNIGDKILGLVISRKGAALLSAILLGSVYFGYKGIIDSRSIDNEKLMRILQDNGRLRIDSEHRTQILKIVKDGNVIDSIKIVYNPDVKNNIYSFYSYHKGIGRAFQDAVDANTSLVNLVNGRLRL